MQRYLYETCLDIGDWSIDGRSSVCRGSETSGYFSWSQIATQKSLRRGRSPLQQVRFGLLFLYTLWQSIHGQSHLRDIARKTHGMSSFYLAFGQKHRSSYVV